LRGFSVYIPRSAFIVGRLRSRLTFREPAVPEKKADRLKMENKKKKKKAL